MDKNNWLKLYIKALVTEGSLQQGEGTGSLTIGTKQKVTKDKVPIGCCQAQVDSQVPQEEASGGQESLKED